MDQPMKNHSISKDNKRYDALRDKEDHPTDWENADIASVEHLAYNVCLIAEPKPFRKPKPASMQINGRFRIYVAGGERHIESGRIT